MLIGSNRGSEKNKAKIVEFPEKDSKFSRNKNFKETNIVITKPTRNTYAYSGFNKPKPRLSSFNSNSSFNKKRDRINTLSSLPPRPTIIALIGVFILLFVFWGFTRKNAQEVFLGNYRIGTISDRKLKAEELEKTAIAKLQSQLGTEVQVNENISLKPVRASKNDTMTIDQALADISKKFTFKVKAAAILVDGKEIAVVKSDKEAKEVLAKISSKYLSEGVKAAGSSTFLEKVEVKNKFINEEDVSSSEAATKLLSANRDQGKSYKVKAGDTLYQIAIDSNMKLQDLLKANPSVNEKTPLKIGQEINLIVPTPLISVVTYEEITYTEPVPKPIETVNNNNEYKTYRKVISAGKDGQKEVKAKIKKVNGVEEGKEVVSEKVTIQPVVEKVEVGTLNTPPKKAIGSFIYPIAGAQISSGYGFRDGENHSGIDLRSPKGTPIKASDGGVVTFSGWGNGYGNVVKINHGNGFQTLYGHNSKNAVSVGQKVAQGEVIGYVGSTGYSTGNHVHFEVIKNGVRQNPLNYLK